MLFRQSKLSEMLGTGGSGAILRIPTNFTGSVEATPLAPDVHPTISATLAPTDQPLVSLMPSALPSITPTTPQQLATSQAQGAAKAGQPSSKVVWYVVAGIVVVLLFVFLTKR